MELINSAWVINIISGIVVAAILFLVGVVTGKTRELRRYKGRNLEEYDFYPFNVDNESRPFFDLRDFRLGVYYFLKHRDYIAARQLILLGEQNEIQNMLDGEELRQYKKLYKKYDGNSIFNDATQYLENYKRIVNLIGESFPDTGIEILLHNLTNPAKSLTAIQNNVTGRKVDDGATNLVLDLKMRKMQNQNKLNYELNIGSRKFKCTTIPIFKRDYGLIGAICINVDVNYLNDDVLKEEKKIQKFFDNICRTDMILDENILSKIEFQKAQEGKKHWLDL